jgi:hypothetical protein
MADIDMDGPCFKLSEDRLSLLAGIPPNISKLSAAVVDEMIDKLCYARQCMLPEVPANWSAGRQEPITALRDLPLTLDAEALNGDPLLHIKHPHYGWLHFVFSRGVAEQIGAGLLSKSNAPPPSTEGNA